MGRMDDIPFLLWKIIQMFQTTNQMMNGMMNSNIEMYDGVHNNGMINMMVL